MSCFLIVTLQQLVCMYKMMKVHNPNFLFLKSIIIEKIQLFFRLNLEKNTIYCFLYPCKNNSKIRLFKSLKTEFKKAQFCISR